MEVITNYARSRVIIKNLLQIPIDIHISKAKLLKNRLASKQVYPFKNIFECKCPIEDVQITDFDLKTIEELFWELKKIPVVK